MGSLHLFVYAVAVQEIQDAGVDKERWATLPHPPTRSPKGDMVKRAGAMNGVSTGKYYFPIHRLMHNQREHVIM